MTLELSKFERFSKEYKPGEIIFCEYEPGRSFYLINSGHVRIVKILGNIEKTIDILKPGEFFGEMSLLENALRSASAIALDDCMILEFNQENFKTLMTGHPQLALKLLQLFAHRIFDQKRRFQILTLDDDEMKVADVFVMLNEQAAVEYEDAYDNRTQEFDLSIADIAHWAGLSESKCNDIMYRFQSKGRVKILQDKIIVLNIHDFARYVKTYRKNQEELNDATSTT